MKKDAMRVMFLLLAVAVLVTGCGRQKRMQQDINLLKTQVGGLTTEVSRVSEENKFVQESLKASEEKRQAYEDDVQAVRARKSGGATTQSGVYRTPSGFELRATALQTALKNAGYYTGSVDGKVGTGTIDAIRRFQSDNGLDADGVCGRKTWDKLRSFGEAVIK